MKFEPETQPTTCETCRFIASQVDGAVTALDAFEGAVRSRDARIAALEAERDLAQANERLTAGILEALRSDYKELEAERDQWRSAHNGLKAQLDMLKAEQP